MATTPVDNSANGVILDALRDCGRLPELSVPSPEQYAEGMRRLRDVVNVLQVDGLKLWVNEDITVALTAGQAAYTFKPGGDVDMTKPLRALEGYYLYDDTGVRRVITQIALRDYWQLGQVGVATSNQGPVTQFVIEKQLAQLKATFWLCPDQDEVDNGDVHLLMQTQITNGNQLTDSTYFPQEWRMALRWALADDWSTGQPKEIMDRCTSRASYFVEKLTNWDVEDAPTSFQPDPRLGQNVGKFR